MGGKKLFDHHAYFIFELLVLAVGFIVMHIFSFNAPLQIAILVLILSIYIILGCVHHHINHDLRARIVLEYVLVGALILSAYVFLNAGRL